MQDFLRYLFAANPRGVTYASAEVLIALAVCAVLIFGSFGIRMWRGRQQNSALRKLSRTWASFMFWFGVIAVVLVVCRVEGIQFFAMRFLWVVWGALLLGIAFLQYRLFRAKYYVVIPQKPQFDPRDTYIPGRRK